MEANPDILGLYDQELLQKCATASSRPVYQIAAGLSVALLEGGPNPLTELADAFASEGNPLMAPKVKGEWKALGVFRAHLVAFLHNRDAVFVGGTAVRSYGGRTEPTGDFDILVDPSFLKEASAFLLQEGGSLTGTAASMVTFHMVPCNTPCELLVADNPLYREAFENTKAQSVNGCALKLVLPAPLGAMKVKAYNDRQGYPEGDRDYKDLRGLVRVGATSRDSIADVLKRHRPELVSVLDEMLR